VSVRRQLPWFALFGIAASATHFAVALSAAHFLAMDPLTANTLAFLCALGVSYLGNAIVTFRVDAWRFVAFVKFAALAAVAFAANQAIVFGLTVRMGWPFWASLLVVLAVVPPLTFALAKLWALAPSKPRA